MKEVVVLSGKGGTGKTSLTASFAALAQKAMLCDADVDAADLHLLTAPKVLETHDFRGGFEAVIQPDQCTGCGLCMDLCRFNAIHPDPARQADGDLVPRVDGLDCEGCGVCVDLCPANAIEFPQKTCGQWFLSQTRFCPMVHARLGIAEENSGRLVALVREQARKEVMERKLDLLITDGPPGIGCPVIASIGQANAVLIVAEPSLSGIHDMTRVAQLTRHFKIPAMVCVNKSDLNPEQTRSIEEIAGQQGMDYLGAIPFDPDFTRAMVMGKAFVEAREGSPAAQAIQGIWRQILAYPAMTRDMLNVV